MFKPQATRWQYCAFVLYYDSFPKIRFKKKKYIFIYYVVFAKDQFLAGELCPTQRAS